MKGTTFGATGAASSLPVSSGGREKLPTTSKGCCGCFTVETTAFFALISDTFCWVFSVSLSSLL